MKLDDANHILHPTIPLDSFYVIKHVLISDVIFSTKTEQPAKDLRFPISRAGIEVPTIWRFAMARSQPVSFGDLHFSKKSDAKAYLKEMLNRYRPGERVSDQDAPRLDAALQRHPEAAEKVGCGLVGFEVHEADYGTQCFWVRRTDDTLERFSYISCV
jgi:hypothetical protein